MRNGEEVNWPQETQVMGDVVDGVDLQIDSAMRVNEAIPHTLSEQTRHLYAARNGVPVNFVNVP